MTLKVRKWAAYKETILSEMGKEDHPPLIKAASLAVIENPFRGRYVQDLSPLVEASRDVGSELVARVVKELDGVPAASYGKAAIIGADGDQEQGVSLLTTVFGNIFREALGGGKAWISSITKRGGPGCTIDVPLAHKDALYVRSHYDGITLSVPDAPLPGEIVMICAVATRGRLNARLGGPSADSIEGKDGLR